MIGEGDARVSAHDCSFHAQVHKNSCAKHYEHNSLDSSSHLRPSWGQLRLKATAKKGRPLSYESEQGYPLQG
uniref:Uncharacterized protein n=1 Tax=Arundo donax TaxID=35708 RepID=A0A0A8ZY29_ARUDO